MDKIYKNLTGELDALANEAAQARTKATAEIEDCRQKIACYDAQMQDAAASGDFNAHTAAANARSFYAQRIEALECSKALEHDLSVEAFNAFGSKLKQTVPPVMSEKIAAIVTAYNDLCAMFDELETMSNDFYNLTSRAASMAGIDYRNGIPAGHPCAPGYIDPAHYEAAIQVYHAFFHRAAEKMHEIADL